MGKLAALDSCNSAQPHHLPTFRDLTDLGLLEELAAQAFAEELGHSRGLKFFQRSDNFFLHLYGFLNLRQHRRNRPLLRNGGALDYDLPHPFEANTGLVYMPAAHQPGCACHPKAKQMESKKFRVKLFWIGNPHYCHVVGQNVESFNS